ncbi:MAG: PVC-type heme-binding CxxCH protein [Chthoniobacter sp.]|uniref:PVC-type heme-binding CxxCH protein n=1 Tax=Chthoniobacter sp. TaxID=2510640 RepID=UPI0032ADDFAF
MKSPLLVPAILAAVIPLTALFAAEEGHGSGASSEGVAPASEEGQNAIKSFNFDAGLKCDLWAAEPLLANPVCFTEDEKGHWYIGETFRQEKGIEDDRGHAEWRDEDIAAKSLEDRLAYMHKHVPDTAQFAEKFAKYEDRIRRLEDTTGSGLANKSTIFADGFRDALDGTGAGLIARGNEVWYTCIPTLWHFRDTKGTGEADVKDKLLTGFGIKFALRGHDMHGLRFGPDGKLYFSIGDRALHVKTKEGKDIAQTESGSIMRCNPDGTDFEIFTTGVRNPQELAFDEHGNLFTGDNNSDAGDKVRFTYLVEGGDCGWRMAFQYLPDRGPWMRERPWDEVIAPSVRYIVPCVANIGNGPSGLTYNPGTGLSPKYYGNFYLSDFRGGASASVVHEIHTEPKGAFFTATHRDWLKGMLTTDVEFGNDGALYVLDWVASWGGVGKGRMYKFTDPANANTALQKETEKLIFDGMTKRSDEELAKLLGHADMRVRQAAQFELSGRGAGSIKTFAAVAADTKAANPLARLHAVWGLGQLAKNAGALDALPALLGDADAEVRAQTANVLGDHKVGAASGKLIELLKDKENRVRFFAALNLGKLGDKNAFEPLCAMLAENDDKDPILRHGGVMGLVGCGTAEQIAAKLHDPSLAVRGDAVVALRRLQSPLVAAFLKDADESVVLEAARAIHDVPIEAAMPALAVLTTNAAIKNANILNRAVNANYRLGKLENAKALAELATNTQMPESARKDAIEALSIWAHPDGKDRLLNQWRPVADRGDGDASAAIASSASALFKDAPASIQETLAKLAGKLSLKNAGEPLALLAFNDKASVAARAEAIKALTSLKDSHLGDVARRAIKDTNTQVRSEGLQALAVADPAAAVKEIAEVLEKGSKAEKQGALGALTQIQNREAVALLSAQLNKLIAQQLPAEIQLDVIDAAIAHDNAELKNKLAQYEAALPASDPLAKWRVALVGGSVERGRKIFREKEATQCLRCHKCETGDSVVGPDLTHVASRKNRDYILESIVFPDKQIAEGFEIAVLTLKDGNVVAGRLAAHSDKELKIETMDAQGKPQVATVAVSQIKDRQRAPSPMPPNLTDFLSKSELRDLVEYLATRK